MDAELTLPYNIIDHFASDPTMDPPASVASPPKRKRKAAKKVEVSTSVHFAVTKLSTYPDLDRGLVFNCIQTFQREFDIASYCVGMGNDRVLCYIKFNKPVNFDTVLGLMMTASKNSEYSINPLNSKTKQKNMLCSIYKQDRKPLECLSIEEKHLVPFHLLLPSWLENYVDKQLDLSDPFLLTYAGNFSYLRALVDNQNVTKREEEDEEN